MKPLFASIPHSGEKVPASCDWLTGLPEEVLMCDVDRFVDQLYIPTLERMQIPYVKTDWHRYVVDLNRTPQDIDGNVVAGSALPGSQHDGGGFKDRGFHWRITTKNFVLMKQPISQKLHDELTELIYKPFHQQVQAQYQKYFSKFQKVYHIDLHSMPSLGTSEHRDPGQLRADIVISDFKGKSCEPSFVDKAMLAFLRAGFKVAYNWPYYGGRLTEQYGKPEIGQHAIQIELNRALYMDEVTKKLNPDNSLKIQKQLSVAIENLYQSL
jgi:N-formylglutamate deformylase